MSSHQTWKQSRIYSFYVTKPFYADTRLIRHFVTASSGADTRSIRHFRSQHFLVLIPVWSDILCHSTIWCGYPSDQTFYATAPSDADTRLIGHFMSQHHLMLIPVWSNILCRSTIWCWYPSDQMRKLRIAPLHFSNFSILCQFLILSELLRSSHLSPLVSVVLSVCLSVSVRLGIFQDSWEQSPGIYSVPWRLSGILNKHPAAHQGVMRRTT